MICRVWFTPVVVWDFYGFLPSTVAFWITPNRPGLRSWTMPRKGWMTVQRWAAGPGRTPDIVFFCFFFFFSEGIYVYTCILFIYMYYIYICKYFFWFHWDQLHFPLKNRSSTPGGIRITQWEDRLLSVVLTFFSSRTIRFQQCDLDILNIWDGPRT